MGFLLDKNRPKTPVLAAQKWCIEWDPWACWTTAKTNRSRYLETISSTCCTETPPEKNLVEFGGSLHLAVGSDSKQLITEIGSQELQNRAHCAHISQLNVCAFHFQVTEISRGCSDDTALHSFQQNNNLASFAAMARSATWSQLIS